MMSSPATVPASPANNSSEAVASPLGHQRLASIDAYRGLVMLLMMAEVLRLKQVAQSPATGRVWEFLAYHQTHVEWAGCSLHDLIQPSFSFLVGVALPFSLAARLGKGQSKTVATLHALWRAVVLVGLGIFLRSLGDDKRQTNFTFEDTLTQIGLGYLPLFLLGFARPRWQVIALGALLVGYWGLFAAYPVPASQDFYTIESVGVPPDWPHHYPLDQFEAHWNKNSNAAWAFDRWFLNLFPRETPFLFNRGGYATLSFAPTLATMILGLLAGAWLRRATAHAVVLPLLPHGGPLTRPQAMGRLLVAAVICFAAALAVDFAGLGPIVKRIWTPTWTLFSGGWCLLLMAAFFMVLDVWKRKAGAYPLLVIGANSIAAYVIAETLHHLVVDSLRKHLGSAPFLILGAAYEPLVEGVAVLAIYWLILWWMYRRKIFLKI